MKAKLFLLALSAVMAGGCAGPLETYYRAGVDVSKLDSDLLDCEVEALEAAPVAFQIRQYPTTGFYGGPYYCPSPGPCVSGGWNSQIYSVDVNKRLRARVTDRCMADKGYAQTTLPRCPDTVSAQTPEGRSMVLPPITASSCAIRNSDGTIQIVSVP